MVLTTQQYNTHPKNTALIAATSGGWLEADSSKIMAQKFSRHLDKLVYAWFCAALLEILLVILTTLHMTTETTTYAVTNANHSDGLNTLARLIQRGYEVAQGTNHMTLSIR
jgi:hypothetical protein